MSYPPSFFRFTLYSVNLGDTFIIFPTIMRLPGNLLLGFFQRGASFGASVRSMKSAPLIIFGLEPIPWDSSLQTASDVTSGLKI